MVSKKWAAALGLALATGLILSGCSSSNSASQPSADSSTPFLVYVDAALTGPLSSMSQAQVDGISAAAESINADGGILGHQVKIVASDDGLDPTKAVTLLQQQIDKAKPNLVIHGQTSNQALAMLPVLTRNQILSSGAPQSEAINDQSKYPFAFSIQPQLSTDARAYVAELERRHVKSIGFLAANDAFGQSNVEAYGAAFKAAGIQATFEQYAPTDIDFTAHLQRLDATNPDIIGVAALGAAAGNILTTRAKLGDTATPLLGTTALGDGNNLSLVSDASDWKNVETMVLKANSNQFVPNTGSKALLTLLKKNHSKLDQLMQQYSFLWDSLYLAKDAAEQAKSIDGVAVAKALENLKLPKDSMLITLPVDAYSPTNHFVAIRDFADAYVVVKPGPVVDGTIISIK